MASSAADAPSMRTGSLQIAGLARVRDGLERWLEAERDQLLLWVPVMLGAGVAVWFVMPMRMQWVAAMLAALALAAMALAIGRGGRAGRALAVAAVLVACGIASVWWRAERVAAPVLARPAIVRFEARVERVDLLPARELVRARLAPVRVIAEDGRDMIALPPHLRVNIAEVDAPAGLAPGMVLRLGARLMPPPGAAVPGAYDYSRAAWFDSIGATGRAHPPVAVIAGTASKPGIRQRLSRHIHAQLSGSEGGVASALATGDVGAIAEEDAEAMRRAGLAHLLSVSGLHITAVVGMTMLLALRLLALSPWLALHWRLPLVAAGAGAAAAIGYTLLTGSEVPTIRSCVAALMVLAALAAGREAVTLRLVAVGALVVIVAWPESVMGASFQLSFAAVTAIVALHEHPRVRTWFAADGARWDERTARGLASLLVTGVVVELALMPIAVFHFHKAGVYGAFANIVAIPLTTFVVMPLEVIALLLDAGGLGAPFWWLTGKSLSLLLWIARRVAAAPGSVTALPAMHAGAFAAMLAGGLWIALWRTRWRRLGVVPVAIGAVWALATPAPDLLVTGDGRHVAVRTAGGSVALLRDRAGDYMRDVLAVNGGVDGEPLLLSEQGDARCSRDLCLATRTVAGRRWRILATRSLYLVPVAELIAACAQADIVVSERRLPRGCRPRRLRLDHAVLARTGGVAGTFATGHIATTRVHGDDHPWAQVLNRNDAGFPRAYPGRGPARGRSAADHRRGWRDRAGPSRPRDGNI